MSVPPRADEPVRGAAATASGAMTGQTVLRGGVWTTATRLIPQVYVLVLSIAAARFLGAEDFGRQSFIAFVEISVISILSAGFTSALLRYVGESLGAGRPEAVRQLVRWAYVVEGAAALVGGGALGAAALAGADPRSAWVFAALACSLGIMHTVPSALLVGMQRWRDASIVGLVTGAWATLAAVVVLAAGGGITGIFVVEAGVFAVNLLWTVVLARRALAGVAPASGEVLAPAAWRHLRGRVWRYALPASYGFLLTIVLWRRSEFAFLERYSTEEELAFYSIVFAVMVALTKIPEAMAAVAFPAVATLFGAGEMERIRAGFARAVRFALLFSFPIAAAVLALGPELLRLVYGDEFRGTRPVLLIMAAGLPVTSLIHLSSSLLAGLGLLRVQLAVETGAAALNLGLAYLLIADHGAVGAAIANVVAQGSASVLVFGYALRVVRPAGWFPLSLSRALVVSTLAGLVGWAAVAAVEGVAGLLLGLALGVAALGLLSVPLRPLSASDAEWLEQAAGGRAGRVIGAVGRRCAA